MFRICSNFEYLYLRSYIFNSISSFGIKLLEGAVKLI